MPPESTTPRPQLRRVDAIEGDRPIHDVSRPVSRQERREAAEHDAPRQVGRYEVESLLGVGGGGAVFVARDPELDREVAVKLLSPGGPLGDMAERLKREARALARLNHPNVVPVYDVGVHDDRVFLAMELVKGRPLATWLDGRRSLDEILDAFGQAAQGLIAAHGAGIVHRDFKPDNAIVGEDGRVRVLDFGLAQQDGKFVPPTPDSVDSMDEPLDRLTRTGAILGTPVYMAPEQYSGDPIDERTDQFAFCVALYEALYGMRPFRGKSFSELAAHVTTGRAELPPGRSNVPASIRAVVLRGLSLRPRDRFDSMKDLLDAIERGRPGGKRRRLYVGLGLVAVVAAAGGAWAFASAGSAGVDTQRCAREAAAIDPVWTETRREELRGVFVRQGPPFASQTYDRLDARVDDFVEEWQVAREELCSESTAAAMPTELRDKALDCLEDGRVRLDAMLSELESPTEEAITDALATVSRLVPPQRCSDEADLRFRAAPPDGEIADEVRELRRALAREDAALRAGKRREGESKLPALIVQAESLGYLPVLIEARIMWGHAAYQRGDYERAQQELESAYFEADENRLDRSAMLAAILLADTVGAMSMQLEEGLAWIRRAEAAAERTGEPTPLMRARLATARGHVNYRNGRIKAAAEANREALELTQQVLGPSHPRLMGPIGNLGLTYVEGGELDEAEALYDRALVLSKRALGPTHPSVGDLLLNMASLYGRRGDNERALELSREAERVYIEALGPRHIYVSSALRTAGAVSRALGRNEEAIETHRRSLDIEIEKLGPDHVDVSVTHYNIGVSMLDLERHEDALGSFTRAVDIAVAQLGYEHPTTAKHLVGQAVAFRRLKRFEDSEKALLAATNGVGPSGANVTIQGVAQHHLGLTRLDAGRLDAAREAFEAALAVRQKDPAAHTGLHESQYELAKLVAASDPVRARELAELAQAGFSKWKSGRADDVERWLASQPSPAP